MSAVEEIQAAIETLTKLRDESAVGPWRSYGSGPANGEHWYVFDHDEEMVVQVSSQDGSNEDERRPNAELIATLHRTINAQIALLTHTVEIHAKYLEARMELRWEVAIRDAGDLDLARAINGASK